MNDSNKTATPTENDRPLACFVMGPFRSGTSLMTRVLQRLGLSAGPEDRLFPATPWNPAGYIQRPDVTAFNTALITGAGGSLTIPPSPWVIASVTDPAQFELLDLHWTRSCGPWVLKDPRFCFTFAAWTASGLFERCSPFIVRISREVDQAAASALNHYDVRHYCENSMTTAREVIGAYDRAAAWHCAHLKVPSFHCTLEGLIARPLATVTALAEKLGLPPGRRVYDAVRETQRGRCVPEELSQAQAACLPGHPSGAAPSGPASAGAFAD